MPFNFQVVVDCAQPHILAGWWAEALGWNVEHQDPDFIRSMIDQGLASEADTITHKGKLVWGEAAAIRHPDDEGPNPLRRVLFQTVPEPKTVKNRLHLDVRTGADALESERARLEAMGATYLYTGTQGPHSWITMTDPEGNEFCVG